MCNFSIYMSINSVMQQLNQWRWFESQFTQSIVVYYLLTYIHGENCWWLLSSNRQIFKSCQKNELEEPFKAHLSRLNHFQQLVVKIFNNTPCVGIKWVGFLSNTCHKLWKKMYLTHIWHICERAVLINRWRIKNCGH